MSQSASKLSIKEIANERLRENARLRRKEFAGSKEGCELKARVAEQSRFLKWDAVLDVVEEKAVEALDIPVVTLLLPAWKKYQEIKELANPAKHPPDEELLASLAEHTIEAKREPELVITYLGSEIARIKLALTIELTLEGIVLCIHNGVITEIREGSIKGKATLDLEKKTILEKQLGPVELPGRLDLGKGISLRDTEERTTGVAAGS